MEIRQLIGFYEVARTGSYSKAADTLFLTQSAVSHQIKKLEQELNIKLFSRFGNAVKLTEEGQILSEVVGKFIRDFKNVKRISEDIKSCKIGHLTIAANNAIITYVLPNIIETFRAQFPGIKLKLINRGLMCELLPMVLEDEIDLVIGPRLKQLLHPKINYLFWKSFDRVLLMPKGHPLSRKDDIKLSDIAACPLILSGKGSATRNAIEEVFDQNGLAYEVFMEVDVAENIKKCVQKGLGVSIFSSCNLTAEDKKTFVVVKVNRFFSKIDYGIYYRKDRYITEVTKQFVKHVATRLAGIFPS